MKAKHLLWGAALLVFAACSDDINNVVPEEQQPTTDLITSNGVFTFLPVEQSRVVYNDPMTKALATRATKAEIPTAPQIPGDAKPFENYASTGVYKIESGGSYNVNVGSNPLTLYVNAKNVELSLPGGEPAITIYVLPEASLKLKNLAWCMGTTIKVWGKINFPETDWSQGGKAIEKISLNKTSLIIYSTEEISIDSFETQNGNNTFESYAPVTVTNDAILRGASVMFHDEAAFMGRLVFENISGNEITFESCVTVERELQMSSASTIINVKNTTLSIKGGIKKQNNPSLSINLYDSLLELGGEITPKSQEDNTINLFKGEESIKGINTNGQTSGVRILGSAKILGQSNDKLGVFDNVVILGKTINDLPKLYKLSYSADQDEEYAWQRVGFVKDNVTVNDPEAFLFRQPGDCDYDPDDPFFQNPTPSTTVLPPHKYSATSIDFDENGTLYLSWHSNLVDDGENLEEDGQDHQHGTNLEFGLNDWGPSVEGFNDWGGIIDIVNAGTYNRNEVLFTKTAWNGEHKYNHVKYHDGKLYLASTSKKVGAALHVVPIEAIIGNYAVDNTPIGDGAYRVNLTGKSANCVEVIGDNLVTISGRSVGGINWFSLDDDSNQEKRSINKNTNMFGGKYIYYDVENSKVITLNNTSNATITFYDTEGNVVGSPIETGKKLAPYDGKNVLLADGKNIYICCGQNGLWVYDYSGKEVGKVANYGANAVDIDNAGHIFVATGAGVATFNMNEKEENGDYKFITYQRFSGSGFPFSELTSGQNVPENKVKSSSNFVKVRSGKVYVAYGMYGLFIYNVADLIKDAQ